MNGRLEHTPEHELVALIQEKNCEYATTELFRRHRRKVYLWCYSICHDRDEAVDLTQEVFMRAFGALGGFDGRAGFSTWIYRIARNHCLSVTSTRKRQWRQRLASLDQQEGLDPADPRLQEEMHQAEVTEKLQGLLDSAARVMKDDELQAFVLHHRDGLTVKEITQVLGCTNASGARTLIQNARRKFQRMTG
jgi:RNA polymerase sigma-70 factor (ECF subfamily)